MVLLSPNPFPIMVNTRVLIGLLLVVLVGMEPAMVSAQVLRSSHSLYGRFGAGTSVSETDAATYAIEPFSLSGEIGYQFAPRLSMGMSLTWADYPKANDHNTTMSTLGGVLRWTLFPSAPVTPYTHLGPQVTVGGDHPAGGALFGIGVDYAATRRSTLFAEVTAYATLPDDAIDSRDDGRATFDGLGFWGVGVRTHLRPAPTPPTIMTIEGPSRIVRDSTATFTVRLDASTSRPVRYRWSLGDGASKRGLAVDHRYRLAGEYPISVTVMNAAGRDTYRQTITVQEPTRAPHITTLQSDTARVQTGELVRFRAHVRGTAPLHLAWAFDDGSPSAHEEVLHTYRPQQHIGTLQHQVVQGHAFGTPGHYTVTLSAENPYGREERSLSVEVMAPNETTQPSVACQEPPAPDTVFFDFDHATLRRTATAQLKAHVDRLAACPETVVQLKGRADFVGTERYNRQLSERRAQAVRQFYRRAGIEAHRIQSHGEGEVNAPCPPGARDQGCQAHRHVQSVFLAPTLDVIAENDTQTEQTGWGIVVGSFQDRTGAKQRAQQVRSTVSGKRVVIRRDASTGYHRVVIGAFPSVRDARSARTKWTTTLPADAWVLRLQGDAPVVTASD